MAIIQIYDENYNLLGESLTEAPAKAEIDIGSYFYLYGYKQGDYALCFYEGENRDAIMLPNWGDYSEPLSPRIKVASTDSKNYKSVVPRKTFGVVIVVCDAEGNPTDSRMVSGSVRVQTDSSVILALPLDNVWQVVSADTFLLVGPFNLTDEIKKLEYIRIRDGQVIETIETDAAQSEYAIFNENVICKVYTYEDPAFVAINKNKKA